jgi:hypothetical protein
MADFQGKPQVGVYNQEGRIISMIGYYSPVYQSQHPCLFYGNDLSIAVNSKDRILAIQEALNPQIRFFDLDSHQLLYEDTTRLTGLYVFKSYYDFLVNSTHNFIVTTRYYDMTYDSLNNIWIRYVKLAVEDISRPDTLYEQMLYKYLKRVIKVCPSFNSREIIQNEIMEKIPVHYEVFDNEGKLIQTIVIPDETLIRPGYFGAEKGALWFVDYKNWLKNNYFWVYKYELEP